MGNNFLVIPTLKKKIWGLWATMG